MGKTLKFKWSYVEKREKPFHEWVNKFIYKDFKVKKNKLVSALVTTFIIYHIIIYLIYHIFDWLMTFKAF